MARGFVVFGVILSTWGCGQSPDAVAGPAPPPIHAAAEDHRHVLEVDWVAFSEAELYRAAEVVVRGRVIHQRSGFHRTHPFDAARGRELTAEEAGDDYAELPLTVSTVEIAARLSDARSVLGARRTLEIVQLGGRYADGCWVEPNDQRILQLQDEMVAFLKAAAMVPSDAFEQSGAYAVVGGQQGMVPVRAGLVDPLPPTPFARYARRPVAELARDIEAQAPEGGE